MTQKLAFDNRLLFNHLLFLKHNLKLNYQVSTFRRDILPQCTLCGLHEERPRHIFFECTIATSLRRDTNRVMTEWLGGQQMNTVENTLFTHRTPKLEPRFVLQVLMKEFIWINRCKNTPRSINIHNMKTYMKGVLRPHKRAGNIWFLETERISERIGL